MPELERLRDQIDHIDQVIIEQLAKRQQVVLEIARLKREQNLPILQIDRETKMLARYQEMAAESGLSSELIREIFGLIIQDSCRTQSS